MKKVLKKFNRALSIMLAAAMVLTMVPQTAMPVLAANENPAAESEYVGETGESPTDGQKEEAADSSKEVSDEGNSDKKDDDIANEDPLDEDPDTEDPSEGDVDDPAEEEPVEEEVKDPAIDPDQMTIMEVEPLAAGDTTLWTSIDNSKSDAWKLTAVDPLPEADGKTYITVKKIGDYDAFSTDGSTYYSVDAEARADKILIFDVDVQEGYQFASTDNAKQVKATLLDDSKNAIADAEIAASYENGHYEINLNQVTETMLGANKYPTLNVWADVVEKPYTVTVNKSESGIKKVTYLFTKETTDPDENSTALTSETITSDDRTKNLKIYVEPETGYSVTVKKGDVIHNPVGNSYVYNLGCITKDITVSIDAERTGYEVKSSVVRAASETETSITAEALAAVQVKWGTMVKDGIIPAKYTSLTFALEGLGDLKADVSYNNKTADVPLTPNANGTYTVSMDAIKEMDGITIDVKVRTAVQVAIKMAENAEVKALTYKNAEGEFAALADDTKAKEDEKFEFKVEAVDFFKVTDVTAKTASNEDVAITKTTEGTGDAATTVYSLVAGTEEITITVETELDVDQCYQLDMVVDGDEGSVTALVTKTDGGAEADTPALNAALPASEKVITRNESVKVVLTVNEKYTLADGDDAVAVKFGTEDGTITPVADTDGTYTITLQKGKLATLTVKTERTGLKTKNTVTFDNQTENIDLTVTEVADKVVKDENVEGKYNLAIGVKDLDFTLVANGPYTPTVKYSTSIEVKPKNTVKEDGKTTYTYSLAAALLGEDDTIVITETESKKTLTVIYDEESVDVTLKQGTQEVDSDTVAGGVSAQVTEGDILTVIAQAKDNCTLDSIKEKVGDAEETAVADFKRGSLFYKSDVTADDDVTITITAAKDIKVLPLKDLDNDTDLALNKSKKYDVSYGGRYEAAVMEGTAKMKPAKFRITTKVSGKDVVVDEQNEDGDVNYTANFTAGVSDAVQITLGAGLAGKECTLELYKDSAEDAKPVATYALKVSAVPAAINDADVKINGGKAITQTADTVKDYKVTVNKGADVSALQFEVIAEDQSKDVVQLAAIQDGQLRLMTGYGVGTAKLEVYTGTGDNKKYIMSGDNRLQIEVTTTALLDNTKYQPTVKQVSSTDVSLTISLTEKNAPKPTRGTVYYEVELKPNLDALSDADKAKLLQTVPVQYIEKTRDAQDIMIYVGANGNAAAPAYGTGAECQYGVNVRLVHVEDGTALPSDGTKLADTSIKSESKLFEKAAGKDFVTKNPTYETNLKLKNGTTTVYTTQEDVVVATPIFSKETSYTVLPTGGAADITSGLKDDEKLDVYVEDNQIKASADEETKLGKHTIQVLATTTDGDTMYASRATVVVTVVRGIESIRLTVPTDSIYYADKAVKVKTAVAYNLRRDDANPKDSVPKAKKVEYKLVATTVNSYTPGDEVEIAPVVKDGVTIDKNGQISVPKNYQVTANSKFKVLVRAADFADNTAYDLSDEITITRDYMQIAKAVIAQIDDSKNYKVIATTDDQDIKTVTASDLNGAVMMAFAPGLPVKDSYTQAEINKYQISSNVSYTSSNKKAVDFDAYDPGSITVNAPANKIKLTAAPTDGSAADKKLNSTKTITLNVTYDPVNTLGLKVTKYDMGGTPEKVYDPIEEGAIDYNDSSTPRFGLTLMSKDGEEWDYAPDYTDYKLTVSKGGKILPKEEWDGRNDVQIAANDKQTTIKLTYKVYNETKKKYDSVTKEYTLTNVGFKAAADAKVKAPKIVFRDKRNTIQSNPNGDRWIGFNLQPNGKDYPLDFVAGKVIGKEGSEGDLYVKVDVDWSAMTAKNKDALEDLAQNMYPGSYQKLNSNGNFGGYVELDFDDVVFTPGSYKLKVSVGTIDDDRNFVPAAQPAAITIKVAKDKALSFKPTTSYKISAKDNGYALLTGKGSYDRVFFDNLQNDNVKGKAKGKENDFTKYFTLDYKADNRILKMTDACFENGALKEISKDDLTGYVSYEARYDYTDSYATVKGTVKITVKLEGKTISKYAVTNATASKDANAVANVTVTADKKPVTIAYALVKEADKGGDWKVVTKSGENWTESLEPCDSVLTLQHTGEEAKGTKAKVTLFVIPEGSYYEAKIADVDKDSLKDAAAKLAEKKRLIGEYGVELKTTITLNDLTDVKTNKRIAVDKANLTQTFTDEYTPYQKGSESGFYTTDRNYWIDVPYTELYVGAKDQIKAIRTDKKDGDAEWITVGRNTEKEAAGETILSIALNKDDMQKHFNDCYLKKTVKGQTVYQPKTIKVKATVYYGGTADAPVEPKDDITFTLTMPRLPYYMNEVGEDGTVTKSDYDKAIEWIKKTENTEMISKSIADNMQKYNYGYLKELSGERLNNAVKACVTGHLEDHIRAYLGDDSGVDLSDLQNRMTVDEESFKVPTTIQKGLVKVTVKLTDGDDKQDGKKETSVVFTVNLPAFEATASDVKDAVEAFLDQAKITNDTTQGSLLKDLRSYMKTEYPAYDTTSIRYEIERFTKTPATEENDGSLVVAIKVCNIADGTEEDTAEKELTIDRLPTADELITAVQKAVGVEAPEGSTTNAVIAALTVSNNRAKVKKAVLDAAEAAITGNPYTVAFEKKATEGTDTDDASEDDDEFDFKPATSTTAGSLSFKLRIKKDGANLNVDDATKGVVTLENAEVAAIEGLLSPADAKTKVNAWITANTLAEGDDASASSETRVLKNGVTAEDILNAIKEDTTNGVPEASKIAVSFKEGTFKITPATLDEDGKIEGTIVLTDTTENEAAEEVTLDVVIPALPQSEAEAVEKIQAAVAKAVTEGTIVVKADTQGEELATVTAAIMKAAEEAEGLKKDAFEITVKTALTITPAADENPAKATITLLVKLGGSGEGKDCEIEIVIPAEEEPET